MCLYNSRKIRRGAWERKAPAKLGLHKNWKSADLVGAMKRVNLACIVVSARCTAELAKALSTLVFDRQPLVVMMDDFAQVAQCVPLLPSLLWLQDLERIGASTLLQNQESSKELNTVQPSNCMYSLMVSPLLRAYFVLLAHNQPPF